MSCSFNTSPAASQPSMRMPQPAIQGIAAPPDDERVILEFVSRWAARRIAINHDATAADMIIHRGRRCFAAASLLRKAGGNNDTYPNLVPLQPFACGPEPGAFFFDHTVDQCLLLRSVASVRPLHES